MKGRLKIPISASIAIAVGLIVLLGYFLEIPLLVQLRTIFLRWAVNLIAVALLLGVANLFLVHWRKFTTHQAGGFFSLALIMALVVTMGVVLFFGPAAYPSLWIFRYIQVPAESSLMAVLAVTLAYASARLLRHKGNVFSLVFVGTVLLVLIGTASFPFVDMTLLRSIRDWIAQVPAAGGGRGILLGVALGIVATGLRILMGVDRPYEG